MFSFCKLYYIPRLPNSHKNLIMFCKKLKVVLLKRYYNQFCSKGAVGMASSFESIRKQQLATTNTDKNIEAHYKTPKN